MVSMRIGVVGTGIMGADHVRTLADSVARAQVTAVTDLDVDRASAAIDGIPGAQVLPDPFAVVADSRVDAVIVASADDSHEEVVLACLEAGKAVLCEKPLAPTAEACLRIVEAETKLGRRLVSVGFMRRYDPGYLELERALSVGLIGDPLMLHNIHRNATSRPNAPSSALIKGSAVHEIDVVRWLFGAEIARISVRTPKRSSLVVGETQDPLFVVLETTSGLLADVEVFVNCRYGYDVRCELVGESGSLSLDEPAYTVQRGTRRVSTGVAADWRDRFAEAYRVELQDWVDGLHKGEQRGANSWDGYAATVVAEAGVQALTSGVEIVPELVARPSLYP